MCGCGCVFNTYKYIYMYNVCLCVCVCVCVCRRRTRTFWACKSRSWGKPQLPSPVSFGAGERVRGTAGTTMVVVRVMRVRVVIKARPRLPCPHTSLMRCRRSFRRFGTHSQKSCNYQHFLKRRALALILKSRATHIFKSGTTLESALR